MYDPAMFIREWIGVPHVYNGRDKDGVDCYGLLWRYYKDVLNIDLPDWSCADSSRLWVAKFMEDKVKERLRIIESPEDHCVGILRRCSAANHVGVVFAGGFLHCIENAATVYQPLNIVRGLYGNVVYGIPILEVPA